ncbi:hypothetical protein PTI98_009697 [Pleurotus ostreatus]|nr:hypothetical protein PTI98_009697 [Pleurotus ostreatus]
MSYSAGRSIKSRTKIKPATKHGPDVSVDQTWNTLAVNLKEVLNNNARHLSFEENHRYAYKLVLWKQGEMLYKGTTNLIVENLNRLAQEDLYPVFPTGASSEPTQQSHEAELLLKALRKVWDEHKSNVVKLSQLLNYMDRVYTTAEGVPKIQEAGRQLFLKHILQPPNAIHSHVIDAVLKQIRLEREGYVINRSAVKECVDVFIGLDTGDHGMSVYERDLKPRILSESDAFYKNEGMILLQTCDAPEYLRRVEARFISEEERTHHYLSPQTHPPLRQLLQDHLLTANLVEVISMSGSGFDSMIDTHKYDDLSRMYRLFIMVPSGIACMKKALKDSVVRRGQEINRTTSEPTAQEVDQDEPSTEATAKGKGKAKARPTAVSQTLTLALKWVQDVLDLKDQFDQLWRQSLQSDRTLESALNDAFETFVNQHERCSEFISLFIDDHLKRGLKGKTDSEIDSILDKTITVFRFVLEKDVFERYYKSHLAKRLLHGRSVSDDAERGMLAKLKVECGYQFTHKLEGMFHDMKISDDTMSSYRTYLENTTPPDIPISVTVMTSSVWPMSLAPTPCNLPSGLLSSCKSFEKFYLNRHSGRRLTWQPTLGNADVKVAFKSRTHELNVSTFALVILLLFEDLPASDFLTYSDIQEATAISDSELQRHLQTLACAKYKILKKHPPGRDVAKDDSFSFNEDFSAPLQKIKISTVASKVETSEERKETQSHLEEERKYQMEVSLMRNSDGHGSSIRTLIILISKACIVRIMKDRKHMTHNDLVHEVTRQLAGRFVPNPLDIKKRIEGLIEKEYLERCDDRKSYNYMA